MKTVEERATEYAYSLKYGYSSVAEEAYMEGAKEQKEIDEKVRLKKSDDMTEAEYDREEAFAFWYAQHGKGTPTFSDAIEWARNEVIDKAYEYAEARYDLDYCGDVKDVLNYLKSLVEE